MKPKNQNLRTLYIKFLRNELSAGEIRRLFPVLAEQSESELRSMISEFMDGEALPVPGEDEKLAHILSVIEATHIRKSKTATLYSKLYKRISVAAAILLIIGFILYQYRGKNNVDTVVEIAAGSSDLTPGGNRATLKLANGAQVDLSQYDGKKDIRQDGVKISASEDGQLVYQPIDEANTRTGLEYNTISTPRGGKFKIILPDSTLVWLNSASSLTYATSFKHAGTRRVRLQGEAYFEVSKALQGGKAVPFIVNTDRQEIKVLGTHFNVNAYPDEAATRTTLLEGKVLLNNKTMLRPGQQGIASDNEIRVKSVNTSEYTDWKTGDFNLVKGDFRTTMRKISRWYDVDIIYDSSVPDQVEVGGWISREKKLSSVLSLIQKTGSIHFKIEGRRVIVSK